MALEAPRGSWSKEWSSRWIAARRDLAGWKNTGQKGYFFFLTEKENKNCCGRFLRQVLHVGPLHCLVNFRNSSRLDEPWRNQTSETNELTFEHLQPDTWYIYSVAVCNKSGINQCYGGSPWQMVQTLPSGKRAIASSPHQGSSVCKAAWQVQIFAVLGSHLFTLC